MHSPTNFVETPRPTLPPLPLPEPEEQPDEEQPIDDWLAQLATQNYDDYWHSCGRW